LNHPEAVQDRRQFGFGNVGWSDQIWHFKTLLVVSGCCFELAACFFFVHRG
jgi:hypothetical protein